MCRELPERHPWRVALEALLSEGALPSRRLHDQDSSKTALDTIMGEVDELSRDR